MAVIFCTENNFVGKVPRNHPNMRTEFAWMVALNATHTHFNAPIAEEFGWGIVIVPKKNPKLAFEFFNRNRNKCKKWAVMQEGPNNGWQDYHLTDQIDYLNLLQQVDHVFVHNQSDVRYYMGLLSSVNVSVMPSLMIDEAIPHPTTNLTQKRSSCVIGGTMCQWYGGMDSLIVAQEFDTDIFAPSMGRMKDEENMLDGIQYLPYMNWGDWTVKLRNFKYAVHLMRTYAAGTFQLNCSYFGIPCIGYEYCDTQRICQPELSVGEGDLVTARRLANKLATDSDFYDHCSQQAISNYLDNYTEKHFITKVSEVLK